MTPKPKHRITVDKLRQISSDLACDESTHHLAGVINCVAAELNNGDDVFRKLDELRGQINLIKILQLRMRDG